ncbi:hypothetical protein EGW08_009075 [Elysia chlorotica]|uniref:Uncharacterized protein n=1 Tax=Elysia chlorotica TaxID=188477 RepID=A0A433TNM3_ELYCH|nr:hypothetical protein EGW08_009075 [Elysia chlorotica]
MSSLYFVLFSALLIVRNINCQAPPVYDCLVGATNCETTGSIIYSSNTIFCCRSGDSISQSSSATFDTTSGLRAHHICKCSPGGMAMINGRPMTPAQKKEFVQEMNRWSINFQNNMNSFFTTLNTNLINMFNRWIF